MLNKNKIAETKISSSICHDSQNPVTENIFLAPPSHFMVRLADYSKMKVYDEKYRKESERLKSLEKSKVLPECLLSSMAKTGLYYKENPSIKDQVCCIYCQGVLSNWKKNDVPVRRHKFSYPTCPFVINLNVGNKPLKNDFIKSTNEDDNEVASKTRIDCTIPKDTVCIVDDIFDEIDKLCVDYREETFIDYSYLKYLAFQGLYVRNEGLQAFVKCCSCLKEMPILQGIENIGNNLMHTNNCEYQNVDQVNGFCEVELSITIEEIDSRMETRSISQLLKNGIDREVLRSITEYRLKNKGKDFDFQFELLQELRNVVRLIQRKDRVYEHDFGLRDFPCILCLDKHVEMIFLPCGHFKTCLSCSTFLPTCPV